MVFYAYAAAYIVTRYQILIHFITSFKSRTVRKNYLCKLLGLRLGKIYEATSPVPEETSFQWAITFPFYVPKRLVALGLVQRYVDMFDYGIDKAFKQLDCSSKVKQQWPL